MTPIATEAEAGGSPPDTAIRTKDEMAAELKITRRTLTVWMRRGLIPFYKIGRTVRFNIHSVRAHLEANCRVGGRS